MLILVYLVCILCQANSLEPNDNSAVYPMENSEKLMLTIPTEEMENLITDSFIPTSTAETLTTLAENSITTIEKDISVNSSDENGNNTTENENSLVENESSTTETCIEENQVSAVENVVEPDKENDTSVEKSNNSVHDNDSSIKEIGLSTTEGGNSYIQTEASTTVTQNSVSKHDGPDFWTDSTFPMQESTTTAMPFIEPIEHEKEPTENIEARSYKASTTEENTVTDTSTEESTTALNQIENENHGTSTTEAMLILPTPILIDPDMQEISAVPTKRSLSPKELQMFKEDLLEATTKTELETTTSAISSIGTSEALIDDISTNALTTTDSIDVQHDQSTSSNPLSSTSPKVYQDNLFLDDNWTNHLSEENDLLEDSHLDLDILQHNGSIFKNDDIESTTSEPTVSKIESNSTPQPLDEKPTEMTGENTNDAPYYEPEEPHPVFSPSNLFNLFAFDHEPSSSNHRATWWPKPKSSPMSVLGENAAKNQKKRDNRISMYDDSEELDGGHQRMFGQRFNKKLKNSLSMLEKLFGNYFLQ